jgi:ornithine decarboxylase
MQRVRDAIVEAAVTVDIVDVGGGFPSWYPGMEPPGARKPISRSSTARSRALPISYSAELWCEPGRALCAEYASVLVASKSAAGSELYINDGAYGALFDAAHIGWRYPVKLVRDESRTPARWRSASTARPATTSTIWPGRSICPATLAGDYIEIGMLGAYGCAMRTGCSTASGRTQCRPATSRWRALHDDRNASALERRKL